VTSASTAVSGWASKVGAVSFAQTTAGNKPILTRGDNLENRFPGSEDLTTSGGFSGVRTGLGVATMTTTATGNNTYFANKVVPVIAGQTYVLRADIKKVDYNYAYLYIFDGTTTKRAYFKIDDCTPGTVDAGATETIASAGATGCTCTETWTAGATSASGQIAIGLTNADNTSSFNAAATGLGTQFTKIQFRSSLADSTYLPTTTFAQYRGVNGRAAVHFNGSASDMTSTSTLAALFGASAKTVFAVYRPADVTTSQMFLTDSAGKVLIFAADTAEAWWGNNDGPGIDYADRTVVVNTPYVFAATHDGSNITLQMNGGALKTVASGATSALTGTLDLGYNGTTKFFNGDLVEFLTWNRVLSSAELARLQSCMCRDWGANCQ
jgi:hypothetical protein